LVPPGADKLNPWGGFVSSKSKHSIASENVPQKPPSCLKNPEESNAPGSESEAPLASRKR